MTVELWAVDAHHIWHQGLKPIQSKVWTLPSIPARRSQRLSAPVQHQYAWRYLVGFVHPVSGCTLFHLATSVSIPLFEVELDAFAGAVGAGPKKQIVLTLDRAGWHARVHLRVPDHVHLLFLPPYSPELNPAEHLWPLTTVALVNQHFATIKDLEHAQFASCATLQQRPALIRSTTYFHWWRKRIAKRRGPRRRYCGASSSSWSASLDALCSLRYTSIRRNT